MAVDASASAFSGLAEELLVMILESLPGVLESKSERLIEDEERIEYRSREILPNLKKLRLAVREYAHLPRLKAFLFYGIRLVASPEHLKLYESTDLSLLEPYVKRIVFEPTRYSWMLVYDLRQEIHEEMIGCSHATGCEYCARREVVTEQQFLDSKPEGVEDYGKHRIIEKNAQYIVAAEATRYIFESGELRQVWTEILKRLPKVGSFRFGWSNFERDDLLDEGMGTPWVYKPVGEALCTTAFSSLVESGSVVKHLDLCHVGDEKFSWADDGTIENLNLSNLETLIFRPRCRDAMGIELSDLPIDDQVRARGGLALDMIINRASQSIRVLNLLPTPTHCLAKWPSERTLPLPLLSQLCLGDIDIDEPHFEKLIRNARSLEHSRIRSSDKYVQDVIQLTLAAVADG